MVFVADIQLDAVLGTSNSVENLTDIAGEFGVFSQFLICGLELTELNTATGLDGELTKQPVGSSAAYPKGPEITLIDDAQVGVSVAAHKNETTAEDGRGDTAAGVRTLRSVRVGARAIAIGWQPTIDLLSC